MKGFRIALANYAATAEAAFSGVSGFTVSGRWHTRGRHLDYAAESLSLATLERLVHYKRFTQLEPHTLATLEVPEVAITRVERPPVGWDGPEPNPEAQAVGNYWFDHAVSPVLLAPSVVSRGEFNLLIHSAHPAWEWSWVVVSGVPFSFDPRLAELVAARPGSSTKRRGRTA